MHWVLTPTIALVQLMKVTVGAHLQILGRSLPLKAALVWETGKNLKGTWLINGELKPACPILTPTPLQPHLHGAQMMYLQPYGSTPMIQARLTLSLIGSTKVMPVGWPLHMGHLF